MKKRTIIECIIIIIFIIVLAILIILTVNEMKNKTEEIVKNMKSTSHVPIITKPASVSKLGDWEQHVFELEALSTDIYSLMYRSVENRFGGQEWRIGPFMNITAGLKF